MGEKIMNEVSDTPDIKNPSINGKTRGVSNTNKFYFYDGAITGPSGKSIDGIITEQEDGYQVYVTENEGGTETSTLKKIPIIEVSELEHTEDAKQFSKISEFNEWTSNVGENKTYNIKVLSDFSIPENEKLEIHSKLNATLDINGYTITGANSPIIKNNGKLTIIDSKEQSTGSIKSEVKGISNDYSKVVENCENATLNMSSGKLSMSGEYGCDIYNSTNGTVNITGGDIEVKGNYGYGIYNQGKLDVSNNTMTSTAYRGYAIYNNSEQKTIINNSTITQSTSEGGCILDDSGEMEINGVNMTASAYGVYNNSEDTIKIIKGTITTSSICGYNYSIGTIEISDATMTCRNSHVLYNNNSGTINFNSGELTAQGGYRSSYCVYNNGLGTININSGKITGKYESVYNYGRGTINIKGGTITSQSANAVYNTSNGDQKGTIKITGGEITSESAYGVYNYNLGILELGEKIEDESEQKNSPKITGKTYGVYNEGTFNFYEGTITGAEGQSINYNVTDKSPKYQIVKTTANQLETAKLEVIDIVEIENTTYKNMEDVKKAIQGFTQDKEYEIKVLNDMYICLSDNIDIPEETNVTIDLNGKQVEVSVENAITNNGTLTIVDESETDEGKIFGVANGIIYNKDELIINGANCGSINYNNSSNTVYAKAINNTGKLTWQNGNLTVDIGNNYGIYNNENGKIDWIDGIITLNQSKSNQYGIYTDTDGDINWTNGEIDLNSSITNTVQYGIYIKKIGTLKIENIEINNKGYGSSLQYVIYGQNDYNVKEKNKVIISNLERKETDEPSTGSIYGINGYNMDLTVNGGTFRKFNSGDIDIYSSKIDITGGTFEDKIVVRSNTTGTIGKVNVDKIENNGGELTLNDTTVRNFIQNSSNSKTTMNNGNIINSQDGSALEISYGTFTILDGLIEAKNGNAVHIKGSNAIFTMGEVSDENVSNEKPTIKGSAYGVYKENGQFNFYDGIIYGNPSALYGGVDNVPQNYHVEYTGDGETTATLEITSETDRIVSIGNMYFKTLQSAIRYANRSSATIVVYSELNIAEQMTIDQEAKITINLNGHNITATDLTGALITNNGELTIIDEPLEEEDGEQLESRIENSNGYAIVNNGILTLGVKNDAVNDKTPNINGEPNAIDNKGTVKWYDGKIDGKSTNEEKEITNGASVLAERIKANAGNIISEIQETVQKAIQKPRIKLDKERPIWTNDSVTATIYTTDRISLDIVNIIDSEKIRVKSIEVRKVWSMPDDEAKNYRATIQLMKIVDGKKVPVTNEEGEIITVKVIGNAEETIDGLPVNDQDGVEIQYALKEIAVERRTSEEENDWEEIPLKQFIVEYPQE